MPGGGTGRGRGRGRGSGTPRARKSRKKNAEEPPMMFPPHLQENMSLLPPPMEAVTMPDSQEFPAEIPEEAGDVDDDLPPVLEPCNVAPPPPAESEDNSVFNFTEDEEPPPPLHGEGTKKGKTPR